MVQEGEVLVLTHGTFDLLHASHIKWLKQAKAMGDYLVVAVSPDAVVRSYKGSNRPIISQKERVEILNELRCVDHALLAGSEHSSHALNIIDLAKQIRPDILVSNYSNFQTEFTKELEETGVRLVVRKKVGGISTSEIINKLQIQSYEDKTR